MIFISLVLECIRFSQQARQIFLMKILQDILKYSKILARVKVICDARRFFISVAMTGIDIDDMSRLICLYH